MKRWIYLALSVLMVLSLMPMSKSPVKAEDPFTLTIVPGCGYNDLSWSAVVGADRYWIYRGYGIGQEAKQPLTDFPIAETKFRDDINIENGKQYCYYVTAVDANATEFKKSNEACVTPKCFERDECKLELKYQVDNKNYWVNGTQKGPMEAAPMVKWSRTLLLVKYVTNEIKGTTLEWDAALKMVIIKTRDGHTIKMQIGNKTATIDGKETQIDPNNPAVTPIIVSGRTLVPFRFVAENLGATGPDDIKWFGDTKTIVLYFANPDCDECEWVKGNITSVSPITATLTAVSGFKVEFKPCTGNAYSVIAATDLKDTTGKYPISQYKGCVELCIVKGQIKQWKAYPDDKNCCGTAVDCKEIKGKIVKVSPVLFGSTKAWVCQFDDCPLGDVPLEFVLNSLLVDPTGIKIDEYIGCAALCVDEKKNIVSWRALKTESCCDDLACDWKLVRIDKVEQPPAGTVALPATVYAYVCKDGKEGDVVKYTANYTLTDDSKKIPIGRYTGCAKICVDAAGKIIKWIALPDSKDCCGQSTDKCDWITVKVVGVKSITDKLWAVTVAVCKDGQMSEVVVVVDSDLVDENKVKTILKYTGCAKLCVKDGKIVKWIAYPDSKDCCNPSTDNCDWLSVKVVGAKSITDKLWSITVVTCKEASANEVVYMTEGDILDESKAWSILKYTGCAKLCVKDGKIIKWIALPQSSNCCPSEPTDCKMVRGTIKEVKFNENAKRWVIQFVQCGIAKPIEVFCPTDLTDSTGKYPLSQYKGCAEICIKERIIIKWTALPDQECCPTPTDCKPIKGKITKSVYNEKTQKWVVLFIPCGQEKELEFYANTDLLDSTGKYPISQYMGCAELCMNERNIVKWTALPDQECCPPTDCKKIRGVIKEVKYNEDGKRWVIQFKLCSGDGMEPYAQTDITDSTGKYPLSQYKGCAEICVNGRYIISWTALPDQECCPDQPSDDCNWIKGQLQKTKYDEGTSTWVVFFDDCPIDTAKRYTTTVDLLDGTGVFPISQYSGCAKLCVKDDKVVKWIAYPEVKDCCQEQPKEEIVKDCVCFKVAEISCTNLTGMLVDDSGARFRIKFDNADICKDIKVGDCIKLCNFKKTDGKLITLMPDYQLIINGCSCTGGPQEIKICVKILEVNCDGDIPQFTASEIGTDNVWTIYLPNKDLCQSLKEGTCWIVGGYKTADKAIKIRTIRPNPNCDCKENPDETKCICLKVTSVLCSQNFATGTDSSGVTWNLVFTDAKLCSTITVGVSYQFCGKPISMNPPSLNVQSIKPIDGNCPAPEPVKFCVTLRSIDCSTDRQLAYGVDANGKTITIVLSSADMCKQLEAGLCYSVTGNFEQQATGEMVFRSTAWEKTDCPCGAPVEDCWCVQVKSSECSNNPKVIFLTDAKGQNWMLYAADENQCGMLKEGLCFKICGTKIVNDNTQWNTIRVKTIEKTDCPCGQ